MVRLPSVELLESRHAFPCHSTFKVIGAAQDNVTARVVACVRDELRMETDPPFTIKNTEHGRHVSATIAPNGARTHELCLQRYWHQIRTTGPTGAISTTVYDVLNRTVASVNALNQRSTTVYNAANEAIASINAAGIRSTQVYDAAGRGVASIKPKGNRWVMEKGAATNSTQHSLGRSGYWFPLSF